MHAITSFLLLTKHLSGNVMILAISTESMFFFLTCVFTEQAVMNGNVMILKRKCMSSSMVRGENAGHFRGARMLGTCGQSTFCNRHFNSRQPSGFKKKSHLLACCRCCFVQYREQSHSKRWVDTIYISKYLPT